MKVHVGNRIRRSGDKLSSVLEIVEVRTTGYSWRLVPTGATTTVNTGFAAYESDGTDDPYFDAEGWHLVL